MYVDPITYVVAFGAIVVSFLWLRDTRIYARTGQEGYRKAAYWGVLYTALGWFAAAIAGLADTTLLYLGCGLVLLRDSPGQPPGRTSGGNNNAPETTRNAGLPSRRNGTAPAHRTPHADHRPVLWLRRNPDPHV